MVLRISLRVCSSMLSCLSVGTLVVHRPSLGQMAFYRRLGRTKSALQHFSFLFLRESSRLQRLRQGRTLMHDEPSACQRSTIKELRTRVAEGSTFRYPL